MFVMLNCRQTVCKIFGETSVKYKAGNIKKNQIHIYYTLSVNNSNRNSEF